jgi:hypothetical protein
MADTTSSSFVDIFTSLPAWQQKELEDRAQSYLAALDHAIVTVLAPTIGRSEEQYLVADDSIPLYGVGATPQEAMADYRSVVVEYYESLEQDALELAPPLSHHLELLRRVMALTHGAP